MRESCTGFLSRKLPTGAPAGEMMASTLRLCPKFLLRIIFLVALVLEHPDTVLTAQPETLKLSYSALVPSGAPFWIAQELKLFEGEGFKTELLYINAAPRHGGDAGR